MIKNNVNKIESIRCPDVTGLMSGCLRNCRPDTPEYAPKLHRDTINTFWTAIKYEYEGQKQRIIPLSINIFVELLKILVEIKQNRKFLRHDELFNLYDKILETSKSLSDPNEWIKNIPNTITSWRKGLYF